MGELPTARDYVNVHRVDAVCPLCDRWQELDLAALVAVGPPSLHLRSSRRAIAPRSYACYAAGKGLALSRPARLTFHIALRRNAMLRGVTIFITRGPQAENPPQRVGLRCRPIVLTFGIDLFAQSIA
jgi:hypothetical protein